MYTQRRASGIGILPTRRETGNRVMRNGSDGIRRTVIRKSIRAALQVYYYNTLRAKPGYWYIVYLYTRLGRRRANSEISSSHGRCAVACEAAKITSRSYSWRAFTCGILTIYIYIIILSTRDGERVRPSSLPQVNSHTGTNAYVIHCYTHTHIIYIQQRCVQARTIDRMLPSSRQRSRPDRCVASYQTVSSPLNRHDYI